MRISPNGRRRTMYYKLGAHGLGLWSLAALCLLYGVLQVFLFENTIIKSDKQFADFSHNTQVLVPPSRSLVLSKSSFRTTPLQQSLDLPHLPASSNEDDSSSLRLCFVTAEFSNSTQEADSLPVVDPSMRTDPPRHFVFTNLPGLEANTSIGWEKIVMPKLTQKYRRLITASRWPKFLGFSHPKLWKCQVIFYGDAYLLNPVNESAWQEMGQWIRQSEVGLMQSQQPHNTRGIMQELTKNVRNGKASETLTEITKTWIKKQKGFKKNKRKIPVYKNALFGYDPQNRKFKNMALDFWNEYSKEEGSWRDQCYWAWFLFKHKMTPLELPGEGPDVDNRYSSKLRKRLMNSGITFLPFGALGKKGHDGHLYVNLTASSKADDGEE
jgi:hypothetical protein